MKRAKKFSKKAVIEFVNHFCVPVAIDDYVCFEWIDDNTCRIFFKEFIAGVIFREIPSNWSYYVAYTYRSDCNVVLTIHG